MLTFFFWKNIEFVIIFSISIIYFSSIDLFFLKIKVGLMGHFIQTKPKKTRPDPMSNQIGPKKKLTK